MSAGAKKRLLEMRQELTKDGMLGIVRQHAQKLSSPNSP